MADRLFLFNAGCPTEPCCTADEHCGEICLTVNRSEDGGPLEGATVSGAGGTCTTDAEGRCCIPIDDIGTYEFDISREDYDPETIEVAAEECSGDTTIEAPPVTLTPTVETGDYCHTVRVMGCECQVQGATVTITAGDLTWSETRISNADGEVRICIDSPMLRDVTITVSAPLFITQTVGPVTMFAESLSVVTLVTQDIATRWCWGGTPPECRSLLPTTLTATLGGAGWRQDRTSPFGGDYTARYTITRTLDLVSTAGGTGVWEWCGLLADGTTHGRIRYTTIMKWSTQCHGYAFQGALVVTWVPNCTPGSGGLDSFIGNNFIGTDHCPISFSCDDHNTNSSVVGTMTAVVSE